MSGFQSRGETTDRPLARQFSTTGTLDTTFFLLDEIFRVFMDGHNIQGGALAVIQGEAVLAHRGYTLAWPGYPVTQPDSKFRLASISKMVTCAAVTHLVETGRLSWTAHAFPLLAVTKPIIGMFPDGGMDSIAVGELVDHTALMQDGIDDRAISLTLGLTRPPTRAEIIQYLYGLPRLPRLQADGFIRHRFSYSNFGYVILTSIVETAANAAFLSLLRSEIMSDVWVGVTAKSGALPGEVSYDAEGTSPSCFRPDTADQEPRAYGGSFILENSEGAGGLVSTALAIAQLSSKYAVWGRGHRSPGSTRYGRLPGTWTCARSLFNGMDFAFLFNRDIEDESERDLFTWHISQTLDPLHHQPPKPPVGWVAREL